MKISIFRNLLEIWLLYQKYFIIVNIISNMQTNLNPTDSTITFDVPLSHITVILSSIF